MTTEPVRDAAWWKQHFAEGRERKRRHQEYISQFPLYTPDLVVRCPTENADGTPIDKDDVLGCGSANVTWDGRECYDCQSCGIFFAPYAADPPHRRDRDPEET